MSGINKVILLGRLGKDPETRYTSDSKCIASFSLATSYGRGDNEKTEWHRCVAWEKTAEIIGEYCRKGNRLYVEGELQTRKWLDKDGLDRYTTEINVRKVEFIDRNDDSGPTDREQDSYNNRGRSAPARKPAPADVDDDDIPF